MKLDLSVVKNEHDLMEWLYVNFNFPEYFGGNWDAVDECLHDFCKNDVVIDIVNIGMATNEIKEQLSMLEKVTQHFNESGKIKITIRSGGQ